MERLEKILPLSLLSLLVGKSLLLGVNLPEMGAILGLAALHGLSVYLDKHKKIQQIQEVVNKQNEVIEKMAKELDVVRTSVTAVKMQNGMRKMA